MMLKLNSHQEFNSTNYLKNIKKISNFSCFLRMLASMFGMMEVHPRKRTRLGTEVKS